VLQIVERVRYWLKGRRSNRHYEYRNQVEQPKKHFKIIELQNRLSKLGIDVFFGYDADLGPVAEIQYHSEATSFRVSVNRAGEVEDCMRDAVKQAIRLADGELKEKIRQVVKEVDL